MKKLIGFVFTGLVFLSLGFSQAYKVERVENDLILPDGDVAEVTFFKKWGDASKMIKEKDKEVKTSGKKAGGQVVQVDSYMGHGNIMHTADDNEFIKKICDIMSECGATYGVAYVDSRSAFGNKTRQYTFTYFPKGQKLNSEVPELRNSFFDYFEENHIYYQAYVNNREDIMNKINHQTRDTMEQQFLFYLEKTYGRDSEVFARALYIARHTPETVRYYPKNNPDDILEIILLDMVDVYRIYSDSGVCLSLNEPSYVIDQYGSFRTYESYNFSLDACRKVEKSLVPEEIQAAARKSLE